MKPKRKLRFDRILIFFLFVSIVTLCIVCFLNLKITNIYVLGNEFVKEQNILELAGIDSYPSTVVNPSFVIKNRLQKNIYINTAKVYKKGLTKVYIEVVENKPLFYYQDSLTVILSDGTKTTGSFSIPTVVNYITDTYYDKFVKEMSKLDRDILNMISEIKFVPTDVDDNLFLLTMTDGNLVYINIATFNKLNKYFSIKEGLPDKNGILNLDWGNNFEILK